MRILFAMHHPYLPQSGGGSEWSTHDLCVFLSRRSIAFAVLAALAPGDFVWLRNRFLAKVWRRSEFPTDQIMGYPVYRGWYLERGVERAIRDFKPDIAVMQVGHPIPLAHEFLNAGIPCIVYLRMPGFDVLGGPVLPQRPGLSFIANSEFTAAIFEREFGIRPIVIPPLIHPDRYRVKSNRRSVVFVNPQEIKGVEIAFQLAERRKDVPFEFVESWPLDDRYWDKLEKRAKSLGNVRLHRRVADMRQFYEQAKVMLVPSIWNEPWARVVTEAQMSAIPVLASNRGGLSESVGRGGILLDPEADISEWEAALSELWDNESEYRRLSSAALDHSRRPEIQPDYLGTQFLSFVSDHVENHKRLDACD